MTQIALKIGDKIEVIAIESIIYFELKGDYRIYVHLIGDKIKTVNTTLNEFEEFINYYIIFFKINNNTIINILKLEYINRRSGITCKLKESDDMISVDKERCDVLLDLLPG